MRLLTILLTGFLLVSCTCGGPGEISFEELPAPEFPLSEIREGDLAFRKGTGTLSHAITWTPGNKTFSHCGVVFRRPSGEWVVVHAVPDEKEFSGDFDRVKAERLERFFSHQLCLYGELVHTSFTDTASLSRMRSRAFAWVRDSVRFDNKYEMADTSTLYCTELVWELYRREGLDLSQGRRTLVHLPAVADTVLLPDNLYRFSGNKAYCQIFNYKPKEK